MTRRCKPGQRARLIDCGPDTGKIVLVVRYYFGESIDGATWPFPIYPWVVTALGSPLSWKSVDGAEMGRSRTIVVDDSKLVPLSDDDDGLTKNAGIPLEAREDQSAWSAAS